MTRREALFGCEENTLAIGALNAVSRGRIATPLPPTVIDLSLLREGLAARFAGIPDVRYSDDRHWVCGDRGVSEWLLTSTSTTGERIAVRGCDLWQ